MKKRQQKADTSSSHSGGVMTTKLPMAAFAKWLRVLATECDGARGGVTIKDQNKIVTNANSDKTTFQRHIHIEFTP